MKKQLLYITEHLHARLNQDQLQSIQKACLLACFDFHPYVKNTLSFNEIKSPHIILASEQCLISSIEKENFSPNSNFILFGNHKKELLLEKYRDKIKDLRFILGDPPTPLLEIILTHTLNFFHKKEKQNICSNFSQQNSVSLSFELGNSMERGAIQQKITQFFKTQIEKNKAHLTIGASTYAKNLADILEEFLMNAIWDANPKYAHVDRTKPIQLLENEKVHIFCLFDGINLILSVTDPFGSFTSNSIQKHIEFALGIKGEATLQEGNGGAGIGLFMIFKKIGVLVFEVEKGKMTRATAIARSRPRRRTS